MENNKYVEIKNIASFNAMEKSIEAEIMRQKIIKFSGGEIKKITMSHKELINFPFNFYKFYIFELLGQDGVKKMGKKLDKK